MMPQPRTTSPTGETGTDRDTRAVSSAFQAELVSLFLLPEFLTHHPAVLEITKPMGMNSIAAGSAVIAVTATFPGNKMPV